MSPRVRTALISVIGFVVAFGVVLLGASVLRGDEPETDTSTVGEALVVPAGERVAVRGYVFFDVLTGPLLCSARSGDDRPACEGAVMTLENLDPNRLDLIRPEQTDRAFDAYSREQVALLGTKLGAVLVVEDVLR